MKKAYIFFFMFFLEVFSLVSQEALKSSEEEYYDFLSLTGFIERPTLGYRTLSDSVWIATDSQSINTQPASETTNSDTNVWSTLNLGKTRILWETSSNTTNWYLNGINRSVKMRIYGPEWFNSYNSEAPYGQNDGALWQGKGYNSSLTTGVRFEAYGLELTFKPQLCFSQNLAFEYMQPAYSGSLYSGKADTYGYYGVQSLDAPQRFGDTNFFTFDWGDTEARYTLYNFTIGIGTQAIWLGPAQINPILLSNNAPSYPKVDVGLRKTSIYMPYFNWYLGDIEARIWTGMLTESDYFDNDENNNNNMINAISISYSPPFLSGLTFGINRAFEAKWKTQNLSYLLELVNITLENDEQVQGNENQIASIFASWLLPNSGFEIYGEIGIDDYVPGTTGYLRYPFHTMVYTAGLQKHLKISEQKKVYGKVLFEVSDLTMSQDFQFQWPYTFYAHHQTTQGWTNRGQWLGAGNGTGGNSQYLGFEVYYPKGKSNIYIHRSNPDNNYLYAKAVYASAGVPDENGETLDSKYFTNWKASIALGISTEYFITNSFCLSGGFVYDLILNPLYKEIQWGLDSKQKNFRVELGLKYTL